MERARRVKKPRKTARASGADEAFTFTLHPLFFAFGIYYAATSRITAFLVATFSAVLHEAGHAFVAGRYGFTMRRLTLMPYGACMAGDFDGASLKEQIFVALAGPLFSLLIAGIVAGSWWFFPETYAVTETLYDANLSLFLLNLLPALPLDGGRVAYALIGLVLGKRTAKMITKGVGIAVATGLSAVFFIGGIAGKWDASLLFFALFSLCGVFERGSVSYEKKTYSPTLLALKKGLPVRTYAVLAETNVKRALSLASGDALVYFDVVNENGERIKTLSSRELFLLSRKTGLKGTVGDALSAQ